MGPASDHCMSCGLVFTARGCTPDRCNNPEGVAEVERLRKEQAAMVDPPWERPPPLQPVAAIRERLGAAEALLTGARITHGPISHAGDGTSDLNTFRAMLERRGQSYHTDPAPAHGAIEISVPGQKSAAVVWFDEKGDFLGMDGE